LGVQPINEEPKRNVAAPNEQTKDKPTKDKEKINMKLDIIDLDEEPKYSNSQILYHVKSISKNNELSFFAKSCCILDLIAHISDENLFNSTTNLFKGYPFYNKVINSNEKLFIDNSFEISDNLGPNNDKAKFKLKASIFSVALLKELFIYKDREFLINTVVPELTLEVKNRKLFYNLTEISEFIKTKCYSEIGKKTLELPTKPEQENEIKKILLSMSVISFENDSNYFKKEIKHFKNLLKFLPEPTAEQILIKEEVKDKVCDFENNFDKVKEIEVFHYFKTNLVDKKYISESVLNEFLKLAFELEIPPTQKFSFIKLNTQKDIVNIFYNYYKITAGKPYGKQLEYFNLLKNYFNGFENLNLSNFSK